MQRPESSAEHGKGRLVDVDERDKAFPLKALMKKGAPSSVTSKFWWASGWYGDQGFTSQCVGYSWCHWLEDGPVTRSKYLPGTKDLRAIPVVPANVVYAEAQARDPWGAIPHDGTTIRAGAQALVERKLISEYRWAWDVNTILDWLLTKGPLVVGTTWYEGMETIDKKGYISVSGIELGGHAYVLDGANKKDGYFRMKNSWGRGWGKGGFAKISITDFAKLLDEYGAEACTAVEIK